MISKMFSLPNRRTQTARPNTTSSLGDVAGLTKLTVEEAPTRDFEKGSTCVKPFSQTLKQEGPEK